SSVPCSRWPPSPPRSAGVPTRRGRSVARFGAGRVGREPESSTEPIHVGRDLGLEGDGATATTSRVARHSVEPPLHLCVVGEQRRNLWPDTCREGDGAKAGVVAAQRGGVPAPDFVAQRRQSVGGVLHRCAIGGGDRQVLLSGGGDRSRGGAGRGRRG